MNLLPVRSAARPGEAPPAPRPQRTLLSGPDAVVFTAPAPCCGENAEWNTEREDVRVVLIAIRCPCNPSGRLR